jgi:hypothetical protein
MAAAVANVHLRNMVISSIDTLLRNRCKSAICSGRPQKPGRLPYARAIDISAANSTTR